MAKLALNAVNKLYGALTVVQDVDLVIEQGEFVSLLGPSGCGKTTTLRMIAGFMDPSSGSITMDGKLLSSATGSVPPERRGMSMIFQSYAIWPNMTVAQNVAFGLKLRRLTRSEVEERTSAILETVRMKHLAERYPAELSGGQQQRVALARAVVVRPQVLLLDEPLSNLDANLREEMRAEIRRLHDRFEMTTVYVTHDQTEAMATSDRIAVMNGGRLEQVAAPYDIYNAPRTRFVANFIGRTNILQAEATRGGLRIGDAIVPTAAVLREGAEAEVSIRPQHITIHAGAAATPDASRVFVPGIIADRSYLGESWDYTIRCPGTHESLKVSALPGVLHEPGASVSLSFAPRDLVVLN